MFMLSSGGKSVTRHHFLTNLFDFKTNFGYDFKFIFVLECHDEIKNDPELKLKIF